MERQTGKRILFVISGMASWFLMMPPTAFGILMSVVIFVFLAKCSEAATVKNSSVKGKKSIGLLALLALFYVILMHGFVERWVLSSKIGAIAGRLGMRDTLFISLVAAAGIVCSLFFTVTVAGMLLQADEKKIFVPQNNVVPKINGYDAVMCLLIAVVFGLQLATAPFAKGYPGTDSAAFLYIGHRMMQGAVPYVDLFDHKGVLLYLIEYLGLSISGGKFWGVWLFEVAGLFATALFTVKTAALFDSKKETGYLAAFGTLFIFSGYMSIEGGNVVEEYALPWIVLALYIVLKYFVKDSYERKDIVWLGISFAVVFLLRANMITAWIAFLPVVFFYLIYKKRYADIGKCIVWFVAGCAVIFLPALLYFIKSGNLKEMIDCYFTFNFGYSGDDNGILPVLGAMVYLMGETAAGWIVLIISGFLCRKKPLWLLNLWFLVVSLVLASMSGRSYQHYGIMLAPAFVVPFIATADWIFGYKKRTKEKKAWLLPGTGVFTAVFAAMAVFTYNGGQNISEASLFLQENTDENADVLALGNNCRYYLESGRDTSNRFFYQTPPIDVSDELYDAFMEELSIEMPQCIIVPGQPDNTEEGNYGKVLEQLETWEKEGIYKKTVKNSFYAYNRVK